MLDQIDIDRIVAGVTEQIKPLLVAKSSPLPALLTVNDFAARCGVSRWTVQDWITKRKVRKVRGKIPRTELERLSK